MPHLPPLRMGQIFQFSQMAVAIGGKWEYRVEHGVTEAPPGFKALKIHSADVMRVEKCWKGSDGWVVEAELLKDNSKLLRFFQKLDPKYWSKIRALDNQQSPRAMTVTKVGWPKPSARTAAWALEAILHENNDRCLFAPHNYLVYELPGMPFQEAVQKTIEALEQCGVSQPKAALRERGFKV